MQALSGSRSRSLATRWIAIRSWLLIRQPRPAERSLPLAKLFAACLVSFVSSAFCCESTIAEPPPNASSESPAESDDKADPDVEASPGAGEESEAAGKDEKDTPGALQVDPIKIAGRVVDTEGQPAQNATVQIQHFSQSGPVDTEAVTNAQGEFEASVRVKRDTLPNVRVKASSADGRLVGHFRFTSNAEQTASDVVEIELERVKIAAVKVVDADGKPVADARVAVQLGYPHTVSDAMTDESGSTALRLPESERIEAVVAWKNHLGLDYRLYSLPRDQRADVNAKPPEFPVDGEEVLTLSGASPLTVSVVDDEQHPLEGVSLYPWLLKKDSEPDSLNLSYFTPAFSQSSDALGETTFSWLPAWQKSLTVVWPSASGFVHTRGVYDPQTDAGRLVMQLDRLVPIRGRVVDADGKPRGGITVAARGAGYGHDSGMASTVTDERGQYELLVPPEQVYLVVVMDPQWASAPQQGFAVFRNQPVENKDFTLRKATRVFGTLIDEHTREPIGNERVIVYQYGQDLHSMEGVELPNPDNSRQYVCPMQYYNATTDAEGRFEFALGDGTFDIRPPQQEKADKFQVAGESELEMEVTTRLQTKVELVGLVLAKDAQAKLAGARVTGVPRNFSGRDWEATTDDEGKFRVRRLREATYVYAASADGTSAAIGELQADKNTFFLTMQKVGSATGRLVTEESQEPVGGAKIAYGVPVPAVDNGSWSYRFGGTVVTSPDGTFRLDGLVPGWEYTLSLETTADGVIPTLTKVTISPEESATLGDLSAPKPRAPFVPQTLEDRIRSAFEVEGSPMERHERALGLVGLVNQHLLIVFGVADHPCIHRLMDIRFNDRDFRPFSDEFRFMAIPTDEERRGPALELANALDESLEGERGDFLLVVLDRDGTKVATADAGALCEEGELSKNRLLEFLSGHLTEPLDARELLTEALKQAADEEKAVIVQETATWCGPCHLLSQFLDRNRIWEKDYIWVKMDHRWTGARELMTELREGADGGVPWFAILNPEGKMLATSNDPQTKRNIGYPSEKSGQVHFANMLNQTRKRLSEGDVQQLVDALTTKKSGE